jgi:hypothetical protein
MKTPDTEVKSITQPRRREELIAFLEELADPETQERFWIRHEDVPMSSGIDEVFHFFFDDTDIGGNPFGQIGICLRSTEEAVRVKRVTDLLKSMLDRLGDVGSREYMSDPMWPELVARALTALSGLQIS